MHRASSIVLVTISAACFAVTAAPADLVDTYSVGSGAKTSYLQFDFANSNTYLYAVRYDGTLRGADLLAIVALAQPGFFSYETVSFSFGDALLGVTIGADTNAGFGTPPDYVDYWHYWTRDSEATPWIASLIGFADRTVSNGSWDGWVFNSNGQPSAIPTPAAGFLLACVGLTPRRRPR